MAFKLAWSEEALEDIESIASYIVPREQPSSPQTQLLKQITHTTPSLSKSALVAFKLCSVPIAPCTVPQRA